MIVHTIEDTCLVYLLVDPATRAAVAIDAGSGRWLDGLPSYGVDRVTDVLVTHHHRDQVEGLPALASAGARIWVPEGEAELIADVGRHWQRRNLANNYDLHTDRFSLLESVPVAGVLRDYSRSEIGHLTVRTVPTPGHTPGSVSYLIDGLAFTGDLVHSPGKVWSGAALQWSYVGMEGAAMTMASLVQLLDHRPRALLPSHGVRMDDPAAAVQATCDALQDLVRVRLGSPSGLLDKLQDPYVELSPHLLMNRTSESRSYVLLSDSGTALLIDYGYDLTTGIPAGGPRHVVRPWLPSLRALHRDYGIERVEVAIPTHYHDDHVAAFNLMRDVHGTEVWAAAPVARVLENPTDYDLPCLWYEPIPCVQHVASGTAIRWREYELSIHDLPGHTLYASAIDFEVDGRRVLATGDQQTGSWQAGGAPEVPNFQYANGFAAEDYVASAALYRRLQPDLMISGHWDPRTVDPAYLDELTRLGAEVSRVHRALLPATDPVFTGAVRISPYRVSAVNGRPFTVRVSVPAELVVPVGWECRRAGAGEFVVVPRVTEPVRQVPIAAGVTRDGIYLGQLAEALVDVRLS